MNPTLLNGLEVLLRYSLFIIVYLFVACSDFSIPSVTQSESDEDEREVTLEVYMNLPMTSDGYYIFDYPNESPHTYTSVEYISAPMERVFWYSEDFYCVTFMWNEICEPIINYSTYTAEDSSGKQMIYIYQDHIGDTLSVWGCATDVCDGVYFIVTE